MYCCGINNDLRDLIKNVTTRAGSFYDNNEYIILFAEIAYISFKLTLLDIYTNRLILRSINILFIEKFKYRLDYDYGNFRLTKIFDL